MQENLFKAALTCDRNEKTLKATKTAHDTEEGPDWIKQLNELINVDGKEKIN